MDHRLSNPDEVFLLQLVIFTFLCFAIYIYICLHVYVYMYVFVLLLLDLFPFELSCCSSKPTGGAGGSFGQDNAGKSGHANHKSITVPSDWMCISCGYVNFARRTSCLQVFISFSSDLF